MKRDSWLWTFRGLAGSCFVGYVAVFSVTGKLLPNGWVYLLFAGIVVGVVVSLVIANYEPKPNVAEKPKLPKIDPSKPVDLPTAVANGLPTSDFRSTTRAFEAAQLAVDRTAAVQREMSANSATPSPRSSPPNPATHRKEIIDYTVLDEEFYGAGGKGELRKDGRWWIFLFPDEVQPSGFLRQEKSDQTWEAIGNSSSWGEQRIGWYNSKDHALRGLREWYTSR